MSSIYCPNCAKEGSSNWSNEGLDFDEWDCHNENCRVSVYKVPKDLTNNE